MTEKSVEEQAFELWQHDHPEQRDVKRWEELPAWIQRAYVNFLRME